MTSTTKTASLPRNAFADVDKKDVKDLRMVVIEMRDRNFCGQPGFFIEGGYVHNIAECLPLSSRRVGNLLRKYPNVVARALGKTTGEYFKATYHASGRGAFGRLSGGARGVYFRPMIVIR